MKRCMSRALAAALLVIAAAGTGAQAAPPAATDPAKAPTATRQLAVNEQAVGRRFRRDARAPAHSRLRAIQPLPLLHRQGARARPRRRTRPRFRALGQPEIRETAWQTAGDRLYRRRDARQAAQRSQRRARRYRDRQPDGDRRAQQGRRFRGAGRQGSQRRSHRHWPGVAGDRVGRRSIGQDAARAQGVELLPERHGRQRAVARGRQACDQRRPRPRRTRGRGHARDDECGTAARDGRRRLESKAVAAGAAEARRARRRRAAAADEKRLGDPQEQPAARRRAERFLCELGQEAGRRAVSAEAVHEDDQGVARSGVQKPTTSGSSRRLRSSRNMASNTTSTR